MPSSVIGAIVGSVITDVVFAETMVSLLAVNVFRAVVSTAITGVVSNDLPDWPVE